MQHVEARGVLALGRVRDRSRRLGARGAARFVRERGAALALGDGRSRVCDRRERRRPLPGRRLQLCRTAHRQRGRALLRTGAVDPTFPQVEGGSVCAAVADGAGGWFIGGDFTSVGGVPRRHLAHIRADGTLDPVWNPGRRTVFALAVSGSTVYAGGVFTRIGGKTRRGIAALDAQTGEATAWNPNASYAVYALAVSGSTVYAGGDFTRIGGKTRNRHRRARCADGQGDRLEPERERRGARARGLGLDRLRRRVFSRIGGARRTTTSPRSMRRRARRRPGTRTRTAWCTRWRSRARPSTRAGVHEDRRAEPQQHRRARCADGHGDRLEPERRRRA